MPIVMRSLGEDFLSNLEPPYLK